MIDMTLLPEPRRSNFVAICAVSEGESLGRRATLRMGDWLCRKTPVEVRGAPTVSMSGPTRRVTVETHIVGRDVSLEELYPGLWDEWQWAA